MKKITLSLMVIASMSTFALAGGDIAPVEPVVEPPVVVEKVEAVDNGFYVGLGYSYMTFSPNKDYDYTGNALSVLAGYQFNKYFAVEGRYSTVLGDITEESSWGDYDYDDGELSNIGIYLKPMYPVGGLTLYGLLGYGQVTFDREDDDGFPKGEESGFQWGVGASYAMTDKLEIFVDYVKLFDDEGFTECLCGVEEVDADSINLGFTYKF